MAHLWQQRQCELGSFVKYDGRSSSFTCWSSFFPVALYIFGTVVSEITSLFPLLNLLVLIFLKIKFNKFRKYENTHGLLDNPQVTLTKIEPPNPRRYVRLVRVPFGSWNSLPIAIELRFNSTLSLKSLFVISPACCNFSLPA